MVLFEGGEAFAFSRPKSAAGEDAGAGDVFADAGCDLGRSSQYSAGWLKMVTRLTICPLRTLK